jgi:hypothetical protein
MAYSDIALLAADNDFIQRTRACASTEGIADPVSWSNDNQWQMAGTPGFGDKYSYAIATGVDRPGYDPSVISDGDILSAVQTLNAA